MQKQYQSVNDNQNHKLFLKTSSKDHYFQVKHNFNITHITSFGEGLCFANENNEIFKISSDNENNYENISNGTIPSTFKIKFFISGQEDIFVILENNMVFRSVSSEEFENVTHVHSMKNITHACCGVYCGIFVDNYKYINTFGRIIATGFCEISNDDTFKFEYGTIKNISIGFEHLIILNSTSEMYGLGVNDCGQLNGISKNNEQYSSLIKICPTFIKDSIILDAFALPFSHSTVIVTNNDDIFIYGCPIVNFSFDKPFKVNPKVFKLKHSSFNKDEKELKYKTAYKISEIEDDTIDSENDSKFNYEKKEISILGGNGIIALINNKKKKIWLGGKSLSHFTEESIDLKNSDNNFRGDECVINILSCGDGIIGILVSDNNLMNSYLENNLKIVSKSCCKEIPFSDILIKQF